MFDQAVRSWQRNGVHEIVAVIDKSNIKHIMRCQREYVDDPSSATKFRLVVTPKPGKRAALCDGIELATGELIALVDSDTIWDDDVLVKTNNPDENGVVLYTTEPCGFCRQAKALLQARGVDYQEINLAKDPAGRADLVALTGQMTFPQIVVGVRSIGGFRELLEADRAGMLSDLLAA